MSSAEGDSADTESFTLMLPLPHPIDLYIPQLTQLEQ